LEAAKQDRSQCFDGPQLYTDQPFNQKVKPRLSYFHAAKEHWNLDLTFYEIPNARSSIPGNPGQARGTAIAAPTILPVRSR
jgi:hypothetical protein